MRMIAAWLTAAVVGLVVSSGAGATGVYKWVDKDGKTHYGDQPPESGAPVQEVNISTLPLGLQNRLRSLDPFFVITRFGGNLDIGYVCGEFDQEKAQSATPTFPAQVESTNLGMIKVGYGFDTDGRYGHRNYPSTYDNNKCPRPPQPLPSYYPYSRYAPPPPPVRDDSHIQRLIYEIRFNPDVVKAYRGDGSATTHP